MAVATGVRLLLPRTLREEGTDNADSNSDSSSDSSSDCDSDHKPTLWPSTSARPADSGGTLRCSASSASPGDALSRVASLPGPAQVAQDQPWR